MKTSNKKGFGLIMAIMIVTVLFIMAIGFFQVTDFSTKSTHKTLNDLKLYWAVESASNYNVTWWINQEDSVRIDWPSAYEAPVEESTTSKFSTNTYPDENSYPVKASVFERAEGTATDDVFYLHASSVKEHPKFEIDGHEIITVRYKGERKDKEGEAVWVLDSYAWDKETGNLANITLTNVYNENYDPNLEWLANSESIVTSLYSTGFNGAIGAFHEKDVRFGPCYYAEIMRFDLSTSGSLGPKFFQGPVKMSALQSGSPYAQSRWGNSVIENMTGLFDPTHQYGYGASIKQNYANQAEAAAAFSTVMNNGNTPYFKDEVPLSTEGVTWTWDDVVNEGPSTGIYLLPETGAGNVTVTLGYDNTTQTSTAVVVHDGNTVSLPLGSSSGSYSGVAVRSNYGSVNFSGVSNRDFTLVTESNQVVLTDDLYIAEMQAARDYYNNNSGFVNQNQTDESILANLWNMMGQSGANTKLSIISQLNNEIDPVGEPFLINQRIAKPLFTTAAMMSWDGYMGITNKMNVAEMKYLNIGSLITLGISDADGGDASGKWTKALLQDPRYLDPDFGIPDFWGPGPSLLDQYSLSGLNKEHFWSKSIVQKTEDWNRTVWKTGYVPSF